jgi:hypothetical protein
MPQTVQQASERFAEIDRRERLAVIQAAEDAAKVEAQVQVEDTEAEERAVGRTALVAYVQAVGAEATQRLMPLIIAAREDLDRAVCDPDASVEDLFTLHAEVCRMMSLLHARTTVTNSLLTGRQTINPLAGTTFADVLDRAVLARIAADHDEETHALIAGAEKADEKARAAFRKSQR